MNNRHRAVLALVALVFLSGCTLFGGGEIDDEQLTGDQEYDWDSNATMRINLTVGSNTYAAVVDVEGQSELAVYREDTFRGETSVEIGDLKFRFSNGTVVNATHPGLGATRNRDETTIRLPAENGSVGYTAPRSGKSWSGPVLVDGTVRMELPKGTRVGLWGLSRVNPTPDENTVANDRTTLVWNDMNAGDPISVRYYLVRDMYIFGGLLAVVVSVGIGGVTYYYRQVRRAKKKREDVGLDVEMEDDDIGDDGPPPGMR
ncbi:hypothetical protein GRX03_13870 [Halovenus sp. WSH3]|uniref:Lipoprotein n=1 Tax=Halovenus carboxidivorans TaxID=2692199 RepID=A0A6B0T325_9EURY|nr:DUF5803 family protein [Halovenus carboxidivorans]MXR52688.1 hypothetical protein [Halovenus carboxidivorans]